MRLADVADVEDSVEDLRDGRAGERQAGGRWWSSSASPGANIIDTVDRVRGAAARSCAASLPAAIDLSVVLDRTPTIRASLHDVELHAGRSRSSW